MKETIFLTTKTAHLIEICRKLKYADKNIPPAVFLKNMAANILNGRGLVLVAPAEEEPKINGCVVMSIIDEYQGQSLFIHFAWTDPKLKDLSDKFWRSITETAKALDIKKITCTMRKNFAAVQKKYGFKEESRVLERILE
jgi:hypothetical protein